MLHQKIFIAYGSVQLGTVEKLISSCLIFS